MHSDEDKVFKALAVALQGGERYSWIPYLLLWLGLILGGATGALLFARFNVHALWFPTGWAIGLCLLHGRYLTVSNARR